MYVLSEATSTEVAMQLLPNWEKIAHLNKPKPNQKCTLRVVEVINREANDANDDGNGVFTRKLWID